MGITDPAHSKSSNISPLPFVWVDITRGSRLEFHPQFGHSRNARLSFPSWHSSLVQPHWPRSRLAEGPIPTVPTAGSSCHLAARPRWPLA